MFTLQSVVTVYDTVSLQIEPPYYCETPDAYIKVVSEKEMIRVLKSLACVMIANPKGEYSLKEIVKATVCSKDEFNVAFKAAIRSFQRLKELTEEDPNVQIDEQKEKELFSEPFSNELYERTEGGMQ